MLLPLKSTSNRGFRFFPVLKPGRPWAILIVATLLTGLVLSACGEEATPAPIAPTATPIPRFQQENNPDLQFTMNMPFGWNKTVIDANTVVYIRPDNQNFGIGVVSRQIGTLTPDSQRLAQERLDQLKLQFPALRNDPGGGGSLVLVDTTLNVDRLTYTNTNNVDVVQYAVQANNVKAQRAYVLFGVTTAQEADTYRPLFIECFKSFMSTAQDNLAQGSDSGVADPTVIAANAGGHVRPTFGQDQQGQYLRLVQWETPPLNASLKQPRITGLFPYDYIWRLRPFPQPDKPALYLESDKVDKTTAEASMLFGVYKDAFPVNNPTTDDWRKFYTPILELLKNQNLKSYGPNVTVGEVNNTGVLYRAPFTARNPAGEVLSRGVILFSKSSTHGVVSLLSLSPYASVKQSLVDSFDADFQVMVNSFQVKF
jgi:hypothetical protein